jgi:hypothetical protein
MTTAAIANCVERGARFSAARMRWTAERSDRRTALKRSERGTPLVGLLRDEDIGNTFIVAAASRCALDVASYRRYDSSLGLISGS